MMTGRDLEEVEKPDKRNEALLEVEFTSAGPRLRPTIGRRGKERD
jgi:hypothetical protein